MDSLEGLDIVGDISPALEATEDFIHCLDGIPGQGESQSQTRELQPSRQPKQLQEVSSAALGKLSSSGVWGLLAGEQHEVGPLGLAWADHQPPSAFSVLGLGMGLRHGKRSRARSTNDLAAHSKDCSNNTVTSSSNSAFKKGHNRSRSDVNYRPSAYTDNGLPAVDCNTLKNMVLNHQREGEFAETLGPIYQSGLRSNLSVKQLCTHFTFRIAIDQPHLWSIGKSKSHLGTECVDLDVTFQQSRRMLDLDINVNSLTQCNQQIQYFNNIISLSINKPPKQGRTLIHTYSKLCLSAGEAIAVAVAVFVDFLSF